MANYNEEDVQWLYDRMVDDGVDAGTIDDFKESLKSDVDRDWYHKRAKKMGLDVGDADEFKSWTVPDEQAEGSQYTDNGGTVVDQAVDNMNRMTGHMPQDVQDASFNAPAYGQKVNPAGGQATFTEEELAEQIAETQKMNQPSINATDMSGMQWTNAEVANMQNNRKRENPNKGVTYQQKESWTGSYARTPDEFGEMHYGWQRGDRVKRLDKRGLEFAGYGGHKGNQFYNEALNAAERMSDDEIVATYEQMAKSIGPNTDMKWFVGTEEGYKLASQMKALQHELHARDLGFTHDRDVENPGMEDYANVRTDNVVAGVIDNIQNMSPQERDALAQAAYDRGLDSDMSEEDQNVILAVAALRSKDNGRRVEDNYRELQQQMEYHSLYSTLERDMDRIYSEENAAMVQREEDAVGDMVYSGGEGGELAWANARTVEAIKAGNLPHTFDVMTDRILQESEAAQRYYQRRVGELSKGEGVIRARAMARDELRQMFRTKYIDKSPLTPKSDTQYIVQSVFFDNMWSKMSQASLGLAAGEPYHEMKRTLDEGMQMYAQQQASTAARIIAPCAVLVFDAATGSFMPAGAASKGAVTLFGKGVTKGLSWLGKRLYGIGTEAALRRAGENTALRILGGALGGSANFATYEFESELFGGAASGELSAGNLGHAALSGAGKGFVFGFVGGVASKATEGLSGMGALLGEVGTIAAEGTTFTAMDYLQTGQLTPESVGTSFGMAIAGRAAHPVEYATNLLGRVVGLNRKNAPSKPPRISKEMQAKLQDKYPALTALLSGDGLAKDIAKAIKTKGGKQDAGERLSAIEEEYRRMKQDTNVPWSVVRIAEYVVNGRVIPQPWMMNSEIRTDEDGNEYGVTLDGDGRVIERFKFKDDKQREQWQAATSRQSDINRLSVASQNMRRSEFTDVLESTINEVAEAQGMDANVLRDIILGGDLKKDKAYRRTIKDKAYLSAADDVQKAVDEKLKSTESAVDIAIRAVENKYGISIEQALEYPVYQRTEREAKAVEELQQRLNGDYAPENDMSDVEIIEAEKKRAHDDGYQAEGEQLADVKERLEDAAEALAEIRIDPRQFDGMNDEQVAGWLENRGNNPEEAEAVMEYLNAKAAFEGVRDKINDDATDRIEQTNRETDERTNKKSGQIHRVTLKPDNENEPGREGFIIDGKITINEDGTVDRENSDKEVVVSYGDGSEPEIRPIEDVLSGEQPQDPEQLKQEAADGIVAEVTGKAASQMNRDLPFTLGDVYDVMIEGQPAKATVVGEDPQQPGNVVVDFSNGQRGSVPREALQGMADEYREAQRRPQQPVEEQPVEETPIEEQPTQSAGPRDNTAPVGERGPVSGAERLETARKAMTEHGFNVSAYDSEPIDYIERLLASKEIIPEDSKPYVREYIEARKEAEREQPIIEEEPVEVQKPAGKSVAQEPRPAEGPFKMPMTGENKPDWEKTTPEQAYDYLKDLGDEDIEAIIRNNMEKAMSEADKARDADDVEGLKRARAKIKYWDTVDNLHRQAKGEVVIPEARIEEQPAEEPLQSNDTEDRADEGQQPQEEQSRVGFTEEDKRFWSREGEDVVEIMDEAARQMGLSIVTYDDPNGENGYIQNGIIYLNSAKGHAAVGFVMGHEMTHEMQRRDTLKDENGRVKKDDEGNPENGNLYTHFRELALEHAKRIYRPQYVDKTWCQTFDEYVNARLNKYKDHIREDTRKRVFNEAWNRGMDNDAASAAADRAANAAADKFTMDNLLDEVTADVAGSMFTDNNLVRDVLGIENDLTWLQRQKEAIMDWLEKTLARMTGHGEDYQRIKDMQKSLQDLWDNAVRNNRGDRTQDQDKRYSLDTTAQQFGLRFEKGADGTSHFYEDHGRDADGNPILGREITRFMPIHIERSPVGAVLRQGLRDGIISKKQYDDTIRNQCAIMQYFKDTPDLDMFFAVSGAIGYAQMPTGGNERVMRDYYRMDSQGNAVFVPYKSNSETQYGNTFDVTTICRKTQTMIDVMSETMKAQKHGLTVDEVIKIVYDNVYKMGQGRNEGGRDIMVPCNVCYVFNRWVNLGNLFDTMRQLRDRYADKTTEQIQKDRIKNIQALCDHYKKSGNDIEYRKYSDYLKDVEFWSTASNAWKEADKKLGDKSIKTRMDNYSKRVAGLMEERLNEVDQELDALTFKLFNYERAAKKADADKFTAADRKRMEQLKDEKNFLEKGTWFDYVRLQDDYQPIPDDILFDINRSYEFKEHYAGAWKYRTTRGSGMGKAAAAYSPEYFGSGIVGAAIDADAARDMSKNLFMVREPGEDGRWHYKYIDEETWTLKPEAVALLRKAQDKVAAQNYLNGQRFQSTSDARVEYLPDYNTYMLEQMLIGSKGQGFTKVPECAKLFGDTGTMFNLSLIAKGKGYEDITQEQYDALSDEDKRDCAMIDGIWRHALYSDVSGINHGDAFALSDAYPNLQPIMVTINNIHARLCMALAASGRITFNIPYHASGDTESYYLSKAATTGDSMDMTSRADYSDYETDKIIDPSDKTAATARSAFAKIKTGAKLTDAEMDYLRNLDHDNVLRQLYMRFRGEDVDGSPARILNKYLLEKDRGADGYGSFDSQCRLQEWDSKTGEFLTDADGNPVYKQVKLSGGKDGTANLLMTNDYWDRTLTLDQADQNGQAFLDLCEQLGYRPRFSGWKKDKNKGWMYDPEYDFTKCTGYWSNLIDISMYDQQGRPIEQGRIDASAVGVPHFDKEQMTQLGERRLTPMEANPDIGSEVMRDIVRQNVSDVAARRAKEKAEFAQIVREWSDDKRSLRAKGALFGGQRADIIPTWIRNEWDRNPEFVKEIARMAKLSPEKLEQQKARNIEDAIQHAQDMMDEYYREGGDADATPRFSLIDDPEEIRRYDEEIERGDYIVRYRAMADIDGLRAPMSTKNDGVLREATPQGAYERADETDIDSYITPEIAEQIKALQESGKTGEVVVIPGKVKFVKGAKSEGMQFHLVKPDGTDLWAAYNPYIHTSDTPLNDQFASAWRRPELKIVRVLIPKSALQEGNPAKWARDDVGDNKKWNGGVVDNMLPEDQRRKVALAKYVKIDDIVSPDEAVAMYADKLIKNNVTVPFNVITTAEREALVRAGVKIGEPSKKAGKDCFAAYEAWKNESPDGPQGGKRFSLVDVKEPERSDLLRGYEEDNEINEFANSVAQLKKDYEKGDVEVMRNWVNIYQNSAKYWEGKIKKDSRYFDYDSHLVIGDRARYERDKKLAQYARDLVTDMIQGRKDHTNWQVVRGKEISIDDMENLFKSHNEDEYNAELWDRVMAASRQLGVDNIKFNKTRESVAGRVLGGRVRFDDGYFNDYTESDKKKCEAMLHEMLHHATVYAMNFPEKLTDSQRAAVRELESVYERLKADPAFRGEYGIKNAKEMIAELSNPRFREKLKKKNLWQRVIDGVMRLFDRSNEGVEQTDALSFVRSNLEKLLDDFNKDAYTQFAEEVRKYKPRFSLAEGETAAGVTLFSGGGLVEAGLRGIVDPRAAVEFDEKISGVYRDNHGNHIVTADVRDVDPMKLAEQVDGPAEYFHASPVCKNFSVLKNGGEKPLDIETAQSTANAIEKMHPRIVTIENVANYQRSDALKIIAEKLDELGYTHDIHVVDAADYGAATHRRRLILRAVAPGNELPAFPEGDKESFTPWFDRVADLIGDLPETNMPDWMTKRLANDGIYWKSIEQPLIVMSSGAAYGGIGHAFADEAAPTIAAGRTGDRIAMPDGKVYKVTGRVLARLMGLPDSYKLPQSESLAHTILGNGVPVELTRGIIGPLVKDVAEPSAPRFSLSEEQREAQTRSENFKRWFGDWENDPENASKVVDDQGRPMAMTHNTDNEFYTFDRERIGSGQGQAYLGFGFNFSRGRNSAYGNNAMQVYLDARNPLESDGHKLTRADLETALRRIDEGETDTVVAEFAGEYAPFGSREYDRAIRKAINTLMDGYDDLSIYSSVSLAAGASKADKIIEAFKTLGFDSTIERDSDGRIMNAVVFEPTQIKSATENNGEFSRENPDIRFSLSEDTQKIFDTAKRKFGVTNDIREAGYVLPDGTMLDFSGRHELDPGSDSSHLAGSRHTDHRAINQIDFVYDENGDEVDTGVKSDMPDFIKRGAIRIDASNGLINLSVKPTAEQRKVLRQLVAENGGTVDVDFGDGWDTDHSVYYDNTKPAKVLGDIDRYFDEGIKPQSNARFSLADDVQPWQSEQVSWERSALDHLLQNAANNEENRSVRSQAVQAVNSTLADLLRRISQTTDRSAYNSVEAANASMGAVDRAMRAQRGYDRWTVDSLVSMAKSMLKSGMYDGLSPYEVNRLIGKINQGAGRDEIQEQMNTVFDVLMNANLRGWDKQLRKLASLRDVRINQQGVRVMGQVDKMGSVMLRSMRIGMGLSQEDLERRIAEVSDRLASDNSIDADNAAVEMEGLILAQQYNDLIGKYETDNKAIKDQVREQLEKIYDFWREPNLDEEGNIIYRKDGLMSTTEKRRLKPEFGGLDEDGNRQPMTEEAKRMRQQVERVVASLESARRENQVRMSEGYAELTNALGGGVAAAVTRAKEFRENEKLRKQEIYHAANSDLLDVDNTTQDMDPADRSSAANNGILRFFLNPMQTFDKMIRFFGRRSAYGEGRLFNKFMRGQAECSHNEWNSFKAGLDEMDAKADELFGMRWMKLGNAIRDGKKFPPIQVTYWDNNNRVTRDLRQDEAAYIYCVNKMRDGQMKLEAMGIDDAMVEQLVQQLDPRLIQLADWYQGEFLPKRRDYYNQVYERMFGTPMARIENYIHLNINQKSVAQNKELSDRMAGENSPSTITGSLKERKTNVTPIKLHTSLLDLAMQEHQKMEHWAAWGEYNRDLKDLINYGNFRAKVSNLSSKEFGSGSDLLRSFEKCAAIVTGDYQPAGRKSSIDTYAANWAKFVATAKIAFRPFTALKQALSFPAFMSEARPDDLLKATLNPKGSVEWAMKNLPGFAKRWQSRQAGDTRLMETDSDWNVWRNSTVQKLGRAGLWMNAGVDCLTVAVGARGVYETAKRRYLSYGYSEAKAEKKALEDASIAYNASQQSSEGAFTSAQQTDRTIMSIATTCFRNASMGYERRFTTAVRNLKRMAQGGYREDVIENTKKQMMEEGLTEEQAERAAERVYNRMKYHSMMDIANFGFVLPFLWNLGPALIYILGGNDDEQKKELLRDSALHATFGPIEGLTFGGTMSELANIFAGSMLMEGENFKETMQGLRYRNFVPLPIMSDIQGLYGTLSTDAWSGVNDIVNLLVQAGTGVNPETFTDMGVALIDACNGDLDLAKETGFFMMRLANMPKSQVDKIYMDELGLSSEEGAKMSWEELAQRYARYNARKDAPLAAALLSDEAEAAREERYVNRFWNRAKEMLEKSEDEDLQRVYGQGDEQRKMVTKEVAKRAGLEGDRYGEKPDKKAKPETVKAIEAYQRKRSYSDMAEDILLQKAKTDATQAGDDERADKIEKALSAITKARKGMGVDRDTDERILKEIREARKKALKELKITR